MELIYNLHVKIMEKDKKIQRYYTFCNIQS